MVQKSAFEPLLAQLFSTIPSMDCVMHGLENFIVAKKKTNLRYGFVCPIATTNKRV